jgi:hypothetical protein
VHSFLPKTCLGSAAVILNILDILRNNTLKSSGYYRVSRDWTIRNSAFYPYGVTYEFRTITRINSDYYLNSINWVSLAMQTLRFLCAKTFKYTLRWTSDLFLQWFINLTTYQNFSLNSQVSEHCSGPDGIYARPPPTPNIRALKG